MEVVFDIQTESFSWRCNKKDSNDRKHLSWKAVSHLKKEFKDQYLKSLLKTNFESKKCISMHIDVSSYVENNYLAKQTGKDTRSDVA